MSTDAHDLPEAIQWHEGMLLAPHHFQQLALRQEQLLHYHTMMMQPFSWGIRKLRIDQVLLTAGTYRVLELEAREPLPFSLFGHSMGALIAFELTVDLERSGGPSPTRL